MQIVFHINVNSAFLSWEAVYRLCHLGGTVDLREEVAAVGGDMAMRSIAVPASFLTLYGMGRQSVAYWISRYEAQDFVRWTIQDKEKQCLIGTI